MKILFGYDGSPCSDAAAHELRWAGLPPGGEAVALSAAEAWPHVPDVADKPEGRARGRDYPFSSPTLLAARAIFVHAKAEAEALCRTGAERLREALPSDWSVREAAATVSPSSALLHAADSLRPDLIVVGSHGRSAAGRMFLGSVSHAVLVHAASSVRVGRGRRAEDQTLRLLIGFDGSEHALEAVRVVTGRRWPAGTEVRVVTAVPRLGDVEGAPDALLERLDPVTATLRASGALAVSGAVHEGEPRQVLTAVAEDMAADCIFLGARGLSTLQRLLIGSVSTAVAMRAHCTVEVVRPRLAAEPGSSGTDAVEAGRDAAP